MARAVTFKKGEYYHVYNRGVERRVIFNDENDKKRLMLLLYLCNSTDKKNISALIRNKKDFPILWDLPRKEPLVDIGAYCLMPNHFHILLRARVRGGVSTFMQRLSTAYTMYFNRKHKRTGALFEGVFRARAVLNDPYLYYLFAYIHLNPIKIIDPAWKEEGIADIPRAKEYLEHYPFSSYFDFIGRDRIENKILNISEFPEYFKTRDDFSAFIGDWLSYQEENEKEAKKTEKVDPLEIPDLAPIAPPA